MENNEEKWNRRVKHVQMGLWVFLILLQMAAVNCLEVRAETGGGTPLIVQSAESGGETAPVEESTEPSVQSGAEPGIRFVTRQVEKTVVYEDVEAAASLPETLDVQVIWDGDEVTALCGAEEVTAVGERWRDDFSFPITFHSYDAAYYVLGETRVSYNAERPELDGCEEQLLGLIGLSPEEYQITDLRWSGEAYKAETGELCRDAVGTGRKLVRDYRVRYVGTAQLPVRPEPRTEPATEETGQIDETGQTDRTPEPKETETKAVRVQEESSAEAQPQEAEDAPLTLWQKITRTLLVIIGLGVLLFFGGLLVLAVWWVVKKLREWYTGRKR